jgi:hypothetical protein
MKQKRIWTLYTVMATLALELSALSLSGQTGEFGPDRWDLKNAKAVDFLGRKAIMGAAFLKDVQFQNGTIEVDIAASTDRARSYPGIVFRGQPNQDWERVYIRPLRQSLRRGH